MKAFAISIHFVDLLAVTARLEIAVLKKAEGKPERITTMFVK